MHIEEEFQETEPGNVKKHLQALIITKAQVFPTCLEKGRSLVINYLYNKYQIVSIDTPLECFYDHQDS